MQVPPRQRHQYQRVTDDFTSDEVDLVASGFNLETQGKVPKRVCVKADAWLRKAALKEERALVALSEPTEKEQGKISRLLKK